MQIDSKSGIDAGCSRSKAMHMARLRISHAYMHRAPLGISLTQTRSTQASCQPKVDRNSACTFMQLEASAGGWQQVHAGAGRLCQTCQSEVSVPVGRLLYYTMYLQYLCMTWLMQALEACRNSTDPCQCCDRSPNKRLQSIQIW